MIIVFHDDRCGLCLKEINHYKKIAPKGIFDWAGISYSNDKLSKYNISNTEALKLLHVIDNDNKIHIDLDAFILIWQQLKRWRILATLISIPGVYTIANFIYKVFARKRYKKLYGNK